MKASQLGRKIDLPNYHRHWRRGGGGGEEDLAKGVVTAWSGLLACLALSPCFFLGDRRFRHPSLSLSRTLVTCLAPMCRVWARTPLQQGDFRRSRGCENSIWDLGTGRSFPSLGAEWAILLRLYTSQSLALLVSAKCSGSWRSHSAQEKLRNDLHTAEARKSLPLKAAFTMQAGGPPWLPRLWLCLDTMHEVNMSYLTSSRLFCYLLFPLLQAKATVNTLHLTIVLFCSKTCTSSLKPQHLAEWGRGGGRGHSRPFLKGLASVSSPQLAAPVIYSSLFPEGVSNPLSVDSQRDKNLSS